MTQHTRTQLCQIVNTWSSTWNGGEGGRRVLFTGTDDECFAWILDHTPFSVQEATSRQGYKIEPVVVAD